MVFLLKKRSNGKYRTAKVEIFPQHLWEKDYEISTRYRLRIDGRWFPPKEFKVFTKWEIRDLIFKHLKF